MRKKIFFGTGILLICLAVWGIYLVKKPHQNVAGERAVASLTAKNLYMEFLNSENQASQKWVGKVIEITGIISSVSEMGNYISISLSGAPDGGINCSILKQELKSLAILKKGDSITIKGKCTGFLMDVNMVDCVVKN